VDLLFDIFEAQYVIFFLVGFAMLVAGVAIIIYEYRIKTSSIKIKGHVSGVAKEEKKRKKNSTTFYYLLYKFIAPNGKEQEFRGRIGSNAIPKPEKVGQPVTILYTEGKTPKVNGKGMYILGAVLIAMGLLFSGIYVVNFEFNWIAAVVAIAVILFAAVKILTFAAKVPTIKNASSFSEAIQVAVAENKKFMAKTEGKRTTGYSKLDASQAYTKMDKTEVEKAKKKQSVPGWVAIPVGLIAIGLLIGSYYTYKNQSEFLATAILTEGKVIDFKESYDSESGYTYAPIIRFTVGTQSITFTDNMGSSNPSEKRGDKVPVFYNPNDYNDAQMDKGWLNWLLPIILCIIGVVLLYSTSYIYRNRRKKKPSLT
jgi:uncharacterized membrane protein HdeD (DUF308 family)